MKYIKILLPLIALAVMQGCASQMVQPEDMALEQSSKHQAVENNQIVIDNNCVTADAAAVAEAMAKAGISAGSKMSIAQEKLLMYYYEELKPDCIRGKRGASVTGGRFGVTPGQLAWMEQQDVCLRNSLLMRALEAREVTQVVEEGSPSVHLLAIQADCREWREQGRRDVALKHEQGRMDLALKHNIVMQKKEASRRWWSRFVEPYPAYGHRGYGGYNQAPVRVGIGWRHTQSRPLHKSRKCRFFGSNLRIRECQ